MNWLDVAVVLGLAGFALRGFLKGLVAESLAFLGLLLAAAASLYGNPAAADLLGRTIHLWRPLAVLLAAVLVFLAAKIVWVLGLYFLVERGKKGDFRRSGVDRVGGALFGLGKGAIWASLVLLILRVVPMPQAYRSAADGAEVAGTVQGVAPWVGARVASVLPRSARQRYETFHREVAQVGARWRAMVLRSGALLPEGAAPGGFRVSPHAGVAGEAKHPPAKPRP